MAMEKEGFAWYYRTIDAIITLNINGDSQKIYLSRPDKPLLKLSKEEFDTKFQSTNLFSVKCASLEHLIIEMDNLVLELKFDDNGNVIGSNPSIIDQETTLTYNERAP